MNYDKTYNYCGAVLTVITSVPLKAQQWQGATTSSGAIYRPGRVGIGTSTPRAIFDIGAYLNDDPALQLTGKVGAILGRLVEGDNNGTGTYLGVRGYHTQPASSKSFAIEHSFYGSVSSSINFYRGLSVAGGFITFSTDNNTEEVRITASGNVLINKTTQANTNYKLDVEGSGRFNEVVVNTNGADFVFEEKYKLPTLDEVEQYINTNKHLPGIPAASEMQANGVGVSDMQTKLLQKIEELTLYIIELNKKSVEQAEEIKRVSEENKRLIDALQKVSDQ